MVCGFSVDGSLIIGSYFSSVNNNDDNDEKKISTVIIKNPVYQLLNYGLNINDSNKHNNYIANSNEEENQKNNLLSVKKDLIYLQNDDCNSKTKQHVILYTQGCNSSISSLLGDSPFDISTIMRWRAIKGYSLKGVRKQRILIDSLLLPSIACKKYYSKIRKQAVKSIFKEKGEFISQNSDSDFISDKNLMLLYLDQYDSDDVLLLTLDNKLEELTKNKEHLINSIISDEENFEEDLMDLPQKQLIQEHIHRCLKHSDKKIFSIWKWLLRYFGKLNADLIDKKHSMEQSKRHLDLIKQSIQNIIVSHGGNMPTRVKQQYQSLNEEKTLLESQIKSVYSIYFNSKTAENFPLELGGGILSILHQMISDPDNQTNYKSEFEIVSTNRRGTIDASTPLGTNRISLTSANNSPITSTISDEPHDSRYNRTDNVTPIDFSPHTGKQSANILNVPIPTGMQQDFRIYSNNYRIRALKLCGWINTDGYWVTEDELCKLEQNGHFEIASGFAIFRGGDFVRAIRALERSKDEKLKLAATALASLSALSNNGLRGDETNSVVKYWQDMCLALSKSLSDPYLATIFGLFAFNGDWYTVLRESTLPIKERIAISLRFLPDDDLVMLAQELAQEATKIGDLDGIILTGLSPLTVDLISSFVDRTSDVQTASLLCSTFVPRLFKDKRVDKWISTYRDLLDRWELFDLRCNFDVELGAFLLSDEHNCSFDLIGQEISRENIENEISLTINGYTNISDTLYNIFKAEEEYSTDKNNNDKNNNESEANICGWDTMNTDKPGSTFRMIVGGHVQSSQTVIQCQYCKQPITHLTNESNNPDSNKDINVKSNNEEDSQSSKIITSIHHSRIRCCVNCRKPIPRCSLCLMQVGRDFGAAWVTWCQKCGHGGHAEHLSSWFSNEEKCPVASCDCFCVNNHLIKD